MSDQLSSNQQNSYHIPVLKQELIQGLSPKPQGHYLDATLGGGGHTKAILDLVPDSQVWAIDQDQMALAAAQLNLATYGDRVQFWHGNFAEFEPGTVQFDGIMADLGVSSAQFDRPERGFSFRQEAPLDMRMDQRQSLTAADIINHWDQRELAEIFYTYGEERFARRIAQRIVSQRPFATTTALAGAIAEAVPPKYRYGRLHPATRVFQALRIVVNRELTVLETFLQRAPTWLQPHGRLGIISFHSLEDRRVKHGLKASPLLQVLTKKPIVPTPTEIEANGRARSAKLRLAARLPG